jgi:hypothetical protein
MCPSVCETLQNSTPNSLGCSESVWGADTESALYWKRTSASAFIEQNFCVEALLQRHNADFFVLTPQNQKITNEVNLSSLMYRIGQVVSVGLGIGV